MQVVRLHADDGCDKKYYFIVEISYEACIKLQLSFSDYLYDIVCNARCCFCVH